MRSTVVHRTETRPVFRITQAILLADCNWDIYIIPNMVQEIADSAVLDIWNRLNEE